MDIKTYWDKRYEKGAIWGIEPCPSVKDAARIFFKHNIKTVLVSGCGYGRNALFLSKEGFKVDAFDISLNALKTAKTEFQNKENPINYFEDDYLNLKLKKKYKGIYVSNSLHLFLKDKRKKLIECLANLTEKGGILFTTVLSDKDKLYKEGTEVEPDTFIKYSNKPIHFFTKENIIHELSNFFEVFYIKLSILTEPDPDGNVTTNTLWSVGAYRK